jgi:hypothetical protein
MPLEPLSSALPGFLLDPPPSPADSEAKGPPIRQQRRAAQWQADVHREAAYFRRFARTPEEEAAIDAAAEEALAKGPDFTRYRRGSAYMEAPRLSVDRNAVARIKFKLQAIRRGTWKVKDKGKHAGAVRLDTLVADHIEQRLLQPKRGLFDYASRDGGCQRCRERANNFANKEHTRTLFARCP